jgi:predicted O-linked N-acetylglucosamine transferase (SPINDLY family)
MTQDQVDKTQATQEWEQQVIAARVEGDYNRAALLCEQQIELDPENRHAYWHLGLLRLLQEQEEEAQLTWMTVLAEAPSEEESVWVDELLTVLESSAQEQAENENWKLAWTLRQYIREFAPTQIDNLLHLVQLSIRQEQFYVEELSELGLINFLQDCPKEVSTELLLETIRQLPDVVMGHPDILFFVEICLHYGEADPLFWIDALLEKSSRLARFWKNPVLASRYAEFSLKLDQKNIATLRMLGALYDRLHKFDQGIELGEAYYAASNSLLDKIDACKILISCYQKQGGCWAKAEELLQEQTDLLKHWLDETSPDDLTQNIQTDILCNALFLYPYFGDCPSEIRPLQNQIGQYFQNYIRNSIAQIGLDYRPYSNQSDASSEMRKTLRIGYVSSCLDRHSVGWLCRWLFHHHNREKFDIYIYFNQKLNLTSFSETWFVKNAHRSCTLEGDSLGIAKAIQEHEIDILVDLDSLTLDTNYGIFALKPAPVQITWLGLDAMGIPAVDYFIVDPYVVPEHAQDYYSEKLWRLPRTYLAVDGFEVGIPTLRREDLGIPDDAVIYFSSQQAFKRHPNMVRVQLQILKDVSNSYFLVKGFGNARGIQEMFFKMADEIGVSRDRLRFLGAVPNEETHRANLGIADVVLDTFPYNGATTTMETLWMGIPLVTKVGQQFAARNSYTMMMNAGITEGIAWSDEEYLEWGIRLGNDADLRDQIRWKLRQSRRTSPLWNGEQFTRQMEAAYEQMWEIYCKGEET